MIVSKHVIFNRQSAERIGKVVRKSEVNKPPDKGPPQKRIIWKGGGFKIDRVNELPDIPESECKIVIWLAPDNPDNPDPDDPKKGDGQPWFADQEDDRWYPMIRYTYHSGIPLGIQSS